ncbi:MAG TPA: alpha/beta hydrolase-fold protein [Puia sp.]|nr:alpha/beta hydrolase-fold protein [Puia sp.]
MTGFFYFYWMKYAGFAFLTFSMLACKHPEQQDDQLYSRHLQRQVKLTVIHTPVPDDKSQLNLLILNDGQDAGQFRLREVIDSLYAKHEIKPLVVVAVHAGDRMQEFGVADRPDFEKKGSRAGYYDAFINDELYPYAKKMSGVRKFNTVVIAGCSLGGLSAFDIAWNHPDKINKVGVFSGSFWWRDKSLDDKTYSDDDNRIMYAKLKASRKRPKLQYWFYAGGREETSDRDKDSIIDVIDDSKDIIELIRHKNIATPGDIFYKEVKDGKHDYASWAAVLPDFLIWAFGSR